MITGYMVDDLLECGFRGLSFRKCAGVVLVYAKNWMAHGHYDSLVGVVISSDSFIESERKNGELWRKEN